MWIEKNIIWLGEIKQSRCGELRIPIRSEGQNEARNLSDLIQCILFCLILTIGPQLPKLKGVTHCTTGLAKLPFSSTLKEIKCDLTLFYSISLVFLSEIFLFYKQTLLPVLAI